MGDRAAGAVPAPQHWLVAVYIGLGPMAAGYALWGYAMSGRGADRLSPIGYATPLLSTMLLLATGHPADASTVAGVGLILVCSVGVLCNAHHHPPVPDESASCATRQDLGLSAAER